MMLSGNRLGAAAADNLCMGLNSSLPAAVVEEDLSSKSVCVVCAARPAAGGHLTKPLAGEVMSCTGGVPGESPMSLTLLGLLLLLQRRFNEGSFA